ncbi:MAG: hypothetical protein C0622_07485 [Desulfuromonas sp.]|nr:MAG: hypothetical protein C0622_07485 [Desulfuromonas sp.]
MCLILFAYKYHPDYPLVIAANRDEYFQRPTAAVHWWDTHPGLLAGRDLQGNGTWMGITRSGHLAAVTNIRHGKPEVGNHLSRGILPLDFLTNTPPVADFQHRLTDTSSLYRGYNLLFGSIGNLRHYSNDRQTLTEIEPGIHGLSNADLNTPWPKVARGKKLLEQALSKDQPQVEELIQLLEDKHPASDSELPDTGVGIELERLLSPICITGERYGTRSSTLILVDRKSNVTLYEQERAPRRSPLKSFRFKIES